MNHKQAGIDKRVSEAVYPADILGDTRLMMCSLSAQGAWFKCLLSMWRDKKGSISSPIAGYAQFWGCSIEQTESIMAEFKTHKPCSVRTRNGVVTLVSRRLYRRETQRIQDTKRQRKHRQSDSVTPLSRLRNAIAEEEEVKEEEKEEESEGEKGNIRGKDRCFKPPDVQQVTEYSTEKGLTLDAESFVDFYQSKNWMVGKNKMKDWQAAVRNWARRQKEQSHERSRPHSRISEGANDPNDYDGY